MKHSGHNMDKLIDDNNFIEIVNKVIKMYNAEDFKKNDFYFSLNMIIDIGDLINNFITDKALNNFGCKYDAFYYRRVASNVIRYIQTHLNELY